jgi:hypothetical protein
MNKEQIAFEKWVKQGDELADLSGQLLGGLWFYNDEDVLLSFKAWQARAALDKQDTSELKQDISDLLGLLDESQICPTITGKTSVLKDFYDLLTKIRKHLTND